MPRKSNKNTKSKIVSAAWKLFYEQGYDDTTIEDIIFDSNTSKGTFYHYFEGKDALLGSLSDLFDDKYEELIASLDPNMNSFDKLLYLNRELFGVIENTVPIDLLSRLYASQLITRGEKNLLNRNRVYYKLLKQIVSNGQEKGELTDNMTVNEICKLYAMCERGLMYDWCICNGDYSLKEYSSKIMPKLLSNIKK